MDIHERIVPDIMDWELTEFDLNKDVKVSDWFQCIGFKIQVKHLDHLFRIYIKERCTCKLLLCHCSMILV